MPVKDAPKEFSHLLSHTLQIKIVFKKDAILPTCARIDFCDDIIKIKIEHGAKTCYKCGDGGHEIKMCSQNAQTFPSIHSDLSEKLIDVPNIISNKKITQHENVNTPSRGTLRSKSKRESDEDESYEIECYSSGDEPIAKKCKSRKISCYANHI